VSKLRHFPLIFVLLCLAALPVAATDGWPFATSASGAFSSVSDVQCLYSPDGTKTWCAEDSSGRLISNQTTGVLTAASNVSFNTNTVYLNGGVGAWTTSTGITANAGSARARLAQTQDTMQAAELIGSADAAGEVATYLGTKYTDAATADGTYLLRVGHDIDGTPADFAFSVTSEGSVDVQLNAQVNGALTVEGESTLNDTINVSDVLPQSDSTYALGGIGSQFLSIASDTVSTQTLDLSGDGSRIGTAPSALPTCDASTEGVLAYINDTDDAKQAALCVCGYLTGAGDGTLGWSAILGSSGCP